jgi:hypothetical protein
MSTYFFYLNYAKVDSILIISLCLLELGWCFRLFISFDYDFAESTADKVSSQIFNSDEDDVSQEADEPRIYKNPRNSPSSLCPRDEEQADLYVTNLKKLFNM